MNLDVLRHRLLDAPFQFLSAVTASTLHTFDKDWHSLCEDVDKASHLSLLNEEDASLVHATALQLATLSESFMKADSEAVERTAIFMVEMEDVFSRLALSDVERISPPSHAGRRRSRSSSSLVPASIPAAYSWITQNIHDPYPSGEIKQRLSRNAGRPLRVITDWFKEVRRYIGWVSMCKDHFQGSRALAVQAAKQVYLRDDFASQVSSSSDIVSQFEAIRMRLLAMYPMADDSDNLSDGTDDSFTHFPLSPGGFLPDESRTSRSSNSTPSLIFSSDDEDNHSVASFFSDDAPARSLGKRKSPIDEDECIPLKRHRSGFISDVTEPVQYAALVSTATSATTLTFGTSQPTPRKRRLSIAAADWEDETPLFSSLPLPCNARPLRVSKRRLSVSDSQPTVKRPCLPPAVGPRKQAVSTPVPIAHQTTPAVDEWFRTFELENPLSVELFSNWDVTVENDVFPYDSLYDGSLQQDTSDPLNETPLSDTYQSSTPLDLGASSAIDPSVLDISSAFIKSPAPIPPLSPEPIIATASSAFDLLDAFLSTVNAESVEPQSTQSLGPYAELSLDDSIDIFGDLVDP
ncbi:hypothetical protein EUX98_g9159 [Antrodiella citrinella]|uniref:KN homeodomain domain-containing protein n=1 Tax=Antrodiella citrinella TaxID=2447956 RepID=A0A4S4LZ81_9APHY|nr:hypothetical protein EUX98_g9159 [Antrodiella citrinella]